MIEEKLAELGLKLPSPFRYPNPNRKGCIRTGHLLFVSGHPPSSESGLRFTGKVGNDISESDAYQLARSAALNILSSVRQELGSLDRIARVVKVSGMVNSAAGFNRQFAVVDGASDLFYQLFGSENGCHARTAIGVFELPRDFALEVEAVLEVKPE
jgi:enamine deaminase RidA (YjgF/YER057c/UK114 family)